MNREAIEALVHGHSGDPFALLGRHGEELRSFQPGARGVEVLARESGEVLARLERVHPGGLFAGRRQRRGQKRDHIESRREDRRRDSDCRRRRGRHERKSGSCQRRSQPACALARPPGSRRSWRRQ